MIKTRSRVIIRTCLFSLLTYCHLAIVLGLLMVLTRGRVLLNTMLFSSCATFKVNLRALYISNRISILNLISTRTWKQFLGSLLTSFKNSKLSHIITKLITNLVGSGAWVFTIEQVFSLSRKSKIMNSRIWFSLRETSFGVIITWWWVFVRNSVSIF